MTDLLLDVGPGRTRAAAVERALRHSIVSGQLAAGTRLPSSRELAAELGCARATVVAAYEQLAAEGYLLSARGSGTRVANVGLPASTDEVDLRSPWFEDLLPGEPDPGSFPRQAWAASLRRVLHTHPDSLFGYGDRQGLADLRAALSGYLARSRSVVVDPSRVVIFGGFASALSALAQTFHELGASHVAVEDPTLPPLARTIGGAGITIEPTAVDEEGMSVPAVGQARVAVCTPAHQYPMGVVMTAARRAAIIEWAKECDGWIVEDDYDGEFRYDRRPLGAMQGLDPSRVVYGGTASKALAPGLALGWLVVPPTLLEPLLDTLRTRRAAPSSIEQAALAQFVTSGRLDRHVRAQRQHYRRRRDALLELLTRRAPWLEVTGAAAGLHLAALMHDREEREVIDLAARQSMALFGIGNHSIRPSGKQGLVIGYSRSPAHAFPHALERLGALLDACR